MDEALLDELRELEAQDADLCERAERLRALDAVVAAVRTRAAEIDEFFAAYPDTETRVRVALEEAEREVARRRDEVAAARAELERVRDDDSRAHAQRALARAEDHLEVAGARATRAAEERNALEREAAALPAELPNLAARASAVAAELSGIEAPEAVPRDLADWGGRAHAALFAAAVHADGQRDRIVREANELASMALGEPTFGSTPAQARARVEAVSQHKRISGRT